MTCRIPRQILTPTLIVFMASIAAAKDGSLYDTPANHYQSAAFFLVGYVSGPRFGEFVDWANEYYARTIHSADSINDFSATFGISAGLRYRLSRYFASELDFVSYSMTTKRLFLGTGDSAGVAIGQVLELNMAAISGSMLVLFDLTDKQPAIPFVRAGVSVFPIRLDHRILFWERHTQVAFALDLGAGLDVRILRKLFATVRGDWTFGSTKMSVAHPQFEPDRFTLDLDTMQLKVGVVYVLR